MTKTSIKAREPCIFKIDNLCMIAGLTNERQPFEVVTKMKEDQTILSHKGNQMEIHTQLNNAVFEEQLQQPVITTNMTTLTYGDNQKEEELLKVVSKEELMD